MAKRVGPRMQRAADYVALHPSCKKIDPARYVGPHKSLQYGYQTVNRAIRAGLVLAVRLDNGRYALTAVVQEVK